MKLVRKGMMVLVLLWSFVVDLFASTWQVARIVLARDIHTTPAIVVFPTVLKQRWAVATLAYFTSLTPGSTCLHVSDDRKTLYLHILDAHDPDAIIAKYQRLYERPIAEIES